MKIHLPKGKQKVPVQGELQLIAASHTLPMWEAHVHTHKKTPLTIEAGISPPVFHMLSP